MKITVRIPVKYWFMCSFRLRTSFLGWSIKPLLSILLKIVWTDYYKWFWFSFYLLSFFWKVHFSAVLHNFIWWQDCWLCAMHSMVKSTIFSSFPFKSHATICLNHILMAGCRYHARFRHIFSCLFFLVASFMWSSARDASAPAFLVPVLMHFATLGSSIEKYLITRKNGVHIESSLFCYANAIHFLSVQLDSGQFQENSQEYVR